MVPGERPGPIPLPKVNGFFTHSELPSEGSLRQAEVESAAEEVLAERLGLGWVTSWQATRPRRLRA